MSLKNWSTTAANNNSAAPAGAPEGMTMASVNDTIRQVMADVRTIYAQDTIASAGTTDIGTKDAATITVTGTTTITALGTVSAGIKKTLIFAGALTFTHNATSLILPGTANITTAADDRCEVESLGSGNWRCNWYQRANGQTITNGGTFSTDITMSGASIIEAEGAAVASAATTNIWATDGNTVHVTGTTTITSFGTAPQAGAWMKVIFDGALTLTHGANLSLPGSANITTAADDFAFVYADTTTQLDVVYFKKDGTATVVAASGLSAATQAQVEAVTSDAVALTPLNTKFHPGVAKAWCVVDISGGAPSLTANLNVTSITDNGVGDFTINLTTAFATSGFCAVGMVRGPAAEGTANGLAGMSIDTGTALSASALRVWTKGGGASGVTDVQRFNVAMFGDFA